MVMDQLRVLVVDDSATIRAMVEEIVDHEPGCRVIGVASDADKARRLLGEIQPNVITLDLTMPGLDGWGFLDELREQRHAPIVVLSSATTSGGEAAVLALSRGAEACFDKAKVVTEARAFLRLLKHVVAKRNALH